MDRQASIVRSVAVIIKREVNERQLSIVGNVWEPEPIELKSVDTEDRISKEFFRISICVAPGECQELS